LQRVLKSQAWKIITIIATTTTQDHLAGGSIAVTATKASSFTSTHPI